MITKEITLCGKSVTLGYCYATEIAYQDMAGEEITDFLSEALSSLKEGKMPAIKKTIYFILSSIISFYESKSEEAPLKDKDLMNETTPEEIGVALGTIIGLRSQFYHVDDKDKEETQKTEKKNEKKGKN